jgi:hypothetical protein
VLMKEMISWTFFFCACVGSARAGDSVAAATNAKAWKMKVVSSQTISQKVGNTGIGLLFGNPPAGQIGVIEQISVSCQGPKELQVSEATLDVTDETGHTHTSSKCINGRPPTAT